MKRTIENLTYQRRKKEEEYTKKLKALKDKAKDLNKLQDSLNSLNISAPFAELTAQPRKNRSLSLSFLSKSSKGKNKQKSQGETIAHLLSGFHQTLEQSMVISSELVSTFTDLMETQTALMDSKDKK